MPRRKYSHTQDRMLCFLCPQWRYAAVGGSHVTYVSCNARWNMFTELLPGNGYSCYKSIWVQCLYIWTQFFRENFYSALGHYRPYCYFPWDTTHAVVHRVPIWLKELHQVKMIGLHIQSLSQHPPHSRHLQFAISTDFVPHADVLHVLLCLILLIPGHMGNQYEIVCGRPAQQKQLIHASKTAAHKTHSTPESPFFFVMSRTEREGGRSWLLFRSMEEHTCRCTSKAIMAVPIILVHAVFSLMISANYLSSITIVWDT
jgi:hypothetical protein